VGGQATVPRERPVAGSVHRGANPPPGTGAISSAARPTGASRQPLAAPGSRSPRSWCGCSPAVAPAW